MTFEGLATPLLNPAVILFTALALPWRWAFLRLLIGAALLVAAVYLAGRGARRTDVVAATDLGLRQAPVPPAGLSSTRFLRVLLRLGVRLLPEYLVLVFALGALRGGLFPLGHDLATWGFLGVLVLAVAGTLLAIPTAVEIAVVAGSPRGRPARLARRGPPGDAPGGEPAVLGDGLSVVPGSGRRRSSLSSWPPRGSSPPVSAWRSASDRRGAAAEPLCGG